MAKIEIVSKRGNSSYKYYDIKISNDDIELLTIFNIKFWNNSIFLPKREGTYFFYKFGSELFAQLFKLLKEDFNGRPN